MGEENAEPVAMDANAAPAVSVVLCVNRANPWLRTAIDSVLAQDDPAFEFLIAANACPDTLWNELIGLVGGKGNVRLFRTKIGQLAYNLNFLADQARGDYLVRMDADDVCEPDRIRRLRQALASDPVDVLGSAVTLIDESGVTIGQMNLPLAHADIVRSLNTRTVFCHPAVAIRRQFLLDMRGYLGGFVSEDTDLWLRARRLGGRFRNLPEPLLRYRIHGGQSIASRAGYAEVAAHWLREFLLAPGFYTFKGLCAALAKCLFAPWLPRARAYRGKQDDTSGRGR
ncbi:MAG: glycosyltransferase [Rhodocyclaceae bacterium]|nr:glycosyltransferase [Rhodocyclaceae bacterium]